MSDQYKDAAWLYQQIEVRNRTQTSVAEECGVTAQAISYWVRKHRDAGEWPPGEEETDPSELVFDLEIGDKVDVDLIGGSGWAAPFNVIDAPAPVVWEVPFGEDWTTRQVSVRQAKGNPERELYAAPAPIGLRITGTNDIHPAEAVGNVDHVGTVSRSKLLELQAEAGQTGGEGAVADGGDNRWRRYYEAGGESVSFSDVATPDWLDEGSFFAAVDMADDVDELVHALGWEDRESVEEVVAQLGVADRLGGVAA